MNEANEAEKVFRVRHKPTGQWLWHMCDGFTVACKLVPDGRRDGLGPSEWGRREDALGALVTTTFGIRNLELVELPQPETKP